MEVTYNCQKKADEIVMVKMKLALAERRLEGLANTYRPTGMMGIDYADPSRNGFYQFVDIEALAISIFTVRDEIERLKAQLRKLQAQRVMKPDNALKSEEKWRVGQ